MGKIWLPGGGGGGDGSDECTATKAEVLKGYKAITKDSDDEAAIGSLELTGTAADSQVLSGQTYYNTDVKTKRTGSMVNRGGVSQALNAGGSYTIPAGYHNGSGKVTGNSLSGQTSGTASAGQILNGQTAWVNGNKLTGSMPNRGNWTGRIGVNGKAAIPAGYHSGSGYVDQSINNRGAWSGSVGMNGSASIPEGYHNGQGKVNGPSVTQRGAWTGRIGVNGKAVIPEGYHNGGGYVDQSIPTMGGQTITPGASQQTVSCSGKYMTGNVVINAVSNLSAGNIKKGVNVGGVVGNWEGYVATATDLYLRGNNAAGFSGDSYLTFDSGQITIKLGGAGGNRNMTASSVKFTGYSYINFQGTFSGNYIKITIGNSSASVDVSGTGVWSINISSLQITGSLKVLFYMMSGSCTRIWLS